MTADPFHLVAALLLGAHALRKLHRVLLATALICAVGGLPTLGWVIGTLGLVTLALGGLMRWRVQQIRQHLRDCPACAERFLGRAPR